MKVLWIISFYVLIYCSSGCYYDVEENLYPNIECEDVDISYGKDVVPILNQNCLICHSKQANFGNINFESHDQLKLYVNDGSLIGTIKHADGYSAMPKNNGKLLDCEIDKIESWINDGALNN